MAESTHCGWASEIHEIIGRGGRQEGNVISLVCVNLFTFKVVFQLQFGYLSDNTGERHERQKPIRSPCADHEK